jgi:hypothetical protein
MASTRLQELHDNVTTILKAMAPAIEHASRLAWNPTDGLLPVVQRAVLRRQYDSLDAIVHLVDSHRGYAGVPLLRPACEELFWLRYLHQMDPQVAERLVICMTQEEYLASIRAQDTYAGRSATRDMGLLPHLEVLENSQVERCRILSAIGKTLGWPPRNVAAGTLPSVQFIAKKTDSGDLYRFIYHATSRVVHFSCAELCRRAWGAPGALSLNSTRFHDYWGAFALYWGLRLFLYTTNEYTAWEQPSNSEVDESAVLAAAKAIGEAGAIPIVTAEELTWPTA